MQNEGAFVVVKMPASEKAALLGLARRNDLTLSQTVRRLARYALATGAVPESGAVCDPRPADPRQAAAASE